MARSGIGLEDVQLVIIQTLCFHTFQVTLKMSHLHDVKRIFRYLKGQPKLGLWYPRVHHLTWKLFLIKLAIVANSTTEAEYVAAANCCGQVIKIHTDHNVADLLTKAFDVSRFNFLVASIGLELKGQAKKKTEPEQEYILIPICTTDPLISQGPKESEKDVGIKPTEVNVSGASDKDREDDQATRNVGAKADLNNLETTMNVSPIPTTRIYKDHPKDQIIRNFNSAIQTRKMTEISDKHAMICYINKQRRTNHKDYQLAYLPNFLSQNEPKKVIQALEYQADRRHWKEELPRSSTSEEADYSSNSTTEAEYGAAAKLRGPGAMDSKIKIQCCTLKPSTWRLDITSIRDLMRRGLILLFDDEDGITCLTNDDIFENLALMGWQSQVPRNHGGALAQTWSERVLEKPNVSPLPEGHTSRSREGSMEHTFELMDTVPPTPHASPLLGGYTLGSDEGRLKLKELMAICTKLSKQVLDLEKENDAQAVEILKLKQIVKKLERKRKSSISHPIKSLYKQVESSNDDFQKREESD
ncbi:hypothetical protein Tco_1456316 [Tanacetum coccineum]